MPGGLYTEENKPLVLEQKTASHVNDHTNTVPWALERDRNWPCKHLKYSPWSCCLELRTGFPLVRSILALNNYTGKLMCKRDTCQHINIQG